MSIDMIKKIIPPPAVINEKITTYWGRLESELGIQLSNDYKTLLTIIMASMTGGKQSLG